MKANVQKLVCTLLWLELHTEKDIRKSVFTGKKQLGKKAEHASKFAELLGEVVTDSTKKNLEMRVDAENGATAGKFDLAKRAKPLTSMQSTIQFMRWQETKLVTEKHLKDFLRDTSANQNPEY